MDFPLARIVRPPALPARRTAGSRISTVRIPGSTMPAIWVVPSPPRIEIQVDSAATSSTRMVPGASLEAAAAGAPGAGVEEAGFLVATIAGAGLDTEGVLTGPLRTGSEAEVT